MTLESVVKTENPTVDETSQRSTSSTKSHGRTPQEWTEYALTFELAVGTILAGFFVFALYATNRQERENPEHHRVERPGQVTKTHMGVALGVSLTFAISSFVARHGVRKEKLGHIKLAIILHAVAIFLSIMFLIFAVQQEGSFRLGSIASVMILPQLFALSMAIQFHQQVSAKRSNPNQNEPINEEPVEYLS